MIYKIKIKNTDEFLLLDDQVYEWFTTDPYYAKIDLINNLRRHSSGCAVFQKSWRKADGSYKVETIYPHVIIAEKYLADKKQRTKNWLVPKTATNWIADWRTSSIAHVQRQVASAAPPVIRVSQAFIKNTTDTGQSFPSKANPCTSGCLTPQRKRHWHTTRCPKNFMALKANRTRSKYDLFIG